MEDEGDHRSGLVTRVLGRVFGMPRSLLGRLGGRLMALEHAGIYPLVVGALDLRPDDRVLEIGSGSGAAAAMVAKRVTHGFIAASDPSPVMAAQSRCRLRADLATGRAEVVQAPAERLPFADASFDVAFTIFSLHHWADAEQGMRETLRVLRPAGASSSSSS